MLIYILFIDNNKIFFFNSLNILKYTLQILKTHINNIV